MTYETRIAAGIGVLVLGFLLVSISIVWYQVQRNLAAQEAERQRREKIRNKNKVAALPIRSDAADLAILEKHSAKPVESGQDEAETGRKIPRPGHPPIVITPQNGFLMRKRNKLN